MILLTMGAQLLFFQQNIYPLNQVRIRTICLTPILLIFFSSGLQRPSDNSSKDIVFCKTLSRPRLYIAALMVNSESLIGNIFASIYYINKIFNRNQEPIGIRLFTTRHYLIFHEMSKVSTIIFQLQQALQLELDRKITDRQMAPLLQASQLELIM